LQGFSGSQGLQGFSGGTGSVGPLGYDGRKGLQGIQGIQGIQGTQGAQGIQGFSGTQGLQGLQGFSGGTGSVGPIGYDGRRGLQGIQGIQGIQGTQGAQGIQGFSGTQGLQGLQGAQGLQGLQGFSGGTGSVGPLGYDGRRGLQGLQGAQGIAGTAQGAQGVQGAAGGGGSSNITSLTATPAGSTADLIGVRSSGFTLVKSNDAATPLPMGPVLWYDTTGPWDDIGNSGLTLTSIGQILITSKFDPDTNNSNLAACTLGNGTFLVEFFGTKYNVSNQVVDTGYYFKGFMQGTDVTLYTLPISPLYTSTIETNFGFDYRKASDGFEAYSWKISVVAMKISNTTSGGVTGGGNYGKFRQR
jgi:hypothetical protein